ncbi:hypothetical protein RCL1_007513 [Eukaryota sp. TZLM3-RCL]
MDNNGVLEYLLRKNPTLRKMSGLPKNSTLSFKTATSSWTLHFHYEIPFFSSVAPNDEQTLLVLKKLHPAEQFQFSKPEAHSFSNEVDDIISLLRLGKAVGRSKLSFDILKDCTLAQSVISEDLTSFF